MKQIVLHTLHLSVFSALLLVPMTLCLNPVSAERAPEQRDRLIRVLEETTPLVQPFSFLDLGRRHYDIVRRYASLYGLDYRLVLAIIKQESEFDQNALSERGAQGYMQIMPFTRDEIADELEMSNADLPQGNLHAGIYYLAKLYGMFEGFREDDRLNFTIAAYNAGPGRIYDAQELAGFIGEDPTRWKSIQKVLPLLSKRYYSLHRLVWEKSRPRSGYFGAWKQTTDYVENVRKTYQSYRKML